ncbi:HNH endonuclease signature motif containing protein [Methylocapsa aurea]|uniref:HNH endonuclease signature motif containing protein n=1 Tax=Methylocapsa aurea TaxID=663610 RepID=UPI00056B2356|nr:HNH endonuclease [Methylocapsa aurea]
MPVRAPRICSCGNIVPSNERCACQIKRDQERKYRFDQTRPNARKRGYTAEWTKEAKAFLKANPNCRKCGEPASVVDHIQPHRGNMRLFWNKANWQPLCTHCHNVTKQSEEKRLGI